VGDLDVERLYEELAPAVLGYLRSQRVAEPYDLLGEVFVQVTRDAPRFAGDAAAARRWVFTIAHNRIVDDSRRRARRPATVEAPAEVAAAAAPADPAPTLDPELVDALRQLTPEQREVLVLRFVADLPVEEVAAVTGRRPGAVKTMQRRALARLRSLLSGVSSVVL
jgi:RNA polymerase sigma-70 factor (ECF subfamily)